MTRSKWLGDETSVDCAECGHDLLAHRGGCSGEGCPCPLAFTTREARAIAAAVRIS